LPNSAPLTSTHLCQLFILCWHGKVKKEDKKANLRSIKKAVINRAAKLELVNHLELVVFLHHDTPVHGPFVVAVMIGKASFAVQSIPETDLTYEDENWHTRKRCEGRIGFINTQHAH